MAFPWTASGGAFAAQLSNTDLILTTLALAGALLLAALAIKLADRWRKAPPDDTLSPGDQLARFRELHQQGTLSDAEFARIRSLLQERLRQELQGPAEPAEKPLGPPETGIRPLPPEG